MIKTIPKKKKCKKAKWLSDEALQIAVKRREDKGKGEKERYTHLNAVFQRIRGTLGSSLRSPAEVEDNEGFPPPLEKDLYSPSSKCLEALVPFWTREQ